MSPLAALLVAGAVWLVATRRRRLAALTVGGVAVAPPLGIGLMALGGLLVLTRRLDARRRSERGAGDDVLILAELTALGLSAGLTAGQALEAARSYVDESLAGEIGEVLRSATRRGLAAALADAPGRSRRLGLILSRAVATGAPLVGAVEGFVADQRAEARAAQLEEARRLPVRLMVPLALLVLPGFVLLTVGPTVLAALDRLALPL